MARSEHEIREIISNVSVEMAKLAKEIDDEFLMYLISMVMIASNKQAVIELDKADPGQISILH